MRSSARSRYRQWMTHKLAHWLDQFGSSGCVGCGRCITWCPVGIDITEEAAAITQHTLPEGGCRCRGLNALSSSTRSSPVSAPNSAARYRGCARNVRFAAGEYLFHEGEPANEFYLIRHGTVALELHSPGQQPIVVATHARRRDRRRFVAGAALSLDIRRARFELARVLGDRRPMPAREMRGRSRSRLRDDEAFRGAMLVNGCSAARLQVLDVYGTRRLSRRR